MRIHPKSFATNNRISLFLLGFFGITLSLWAGGGGHGDHSPEVAEAIHGAFHQMVIDIGITVLVGSVVSYLFMLFKLPLILAYLTTGVVIAGNIGFGWVGGSEGLSSISEIGLILLLFMIGMEIDLNKLKAAGSSLIVTGVFQFVVSAALGFGFFLLLGFTMGGGKFDLFYLAVCTAISSTAVVVKLLYGKSELDTLAGRLTLGVLVFQDIWAIVILGVQPNLADPKILEILKSFGLMGVMITMALMIAKYLLPPIFKKVAKLPELMTLTSLGWCLFVCAIASFFGLSLEMGALIAGVGISTFPYTLDVEAKVTNLRDFFILLFFVSLGMQIPNPVQNPSIIYVAIGSAAFVIFARFLSVYPFLKVLDNGNRVSTLTSLNLANISEFSLVIAAIGIREGHIGTDILSTVIFVFVFNAIGASFIIGSNQSLQSIITKYILKPIGLRDKKEHKEPEAAHLDKDIALLGFFRVGSSLVMDFHDDKPLPGEKSLNDKTVVVDFNQSSHDKLKAFGVHAIYGDIANMDTLHHAGIHDVKLAISTIPDNVLVGTDNTKITQQIQAICHHSKIIATAENVPTALKMYEEGADYVVIPRLLAASHLVPITKILVKAQEGDPKAKQDAEKLKLDHINFLKKRTEIIN